MVLDLARKFTSKTELFYRRFKDPEKYLRERRLTELWLKEEFIKKGGNPKDGFPIYFILGNSPYIYDGYDKKCNVLEMGLDQIPENQLSFTFPDSMVSKWLATQKDKIFYQKKYHGQVFTKNEILNILNEISIPTHEWKTQANRKYDFFIEAQIWDLSDLHKLFCKI
ncbi:MAG: hypothetical protein COB02_18385 [Candidatus Cloacimonadota bacterium]|nr:MAG: hypothetical protein COB02_18385 [Candidatus Cloacimonadota bacterium]